MFSKRSIVLLGGATLLAACSEQPLPIPAPMLDAGPNVCSGQVTVLATNLGIVTGIALDEQYVYVGTDQGPVRIPAGGGAPEKVSVGSPRTDLVAVDGTYVYWNDWTGFGQGNGFSRRKKSLAGPDEPIVASGAISCILPEPSSLSWCDFSNSGIGRIFTADRDGRTPRELASRQDGPQQLVAIGDSLYWDLYSADGRLVRVSRGGGQLSSFRLEAQGPNGLATDGHTLYLGADGLMMTLHTGNPVEGILAHDVATGLFRTLTLTPQHPRFVAVDEGFVYWSEQQGDPGRIMKVRKEGGAPLLVADDDRTPDHLAVGARSVFWISDHGSVKTACK